MGLSPSTDYSREDVAVDSKATKEEIRNDPCRSEDFREAVIHRKEETEPLIVAAIDIGTNNSACAYSFRNRHSKDQENCWEERTFLSLYAPTIVLLNPKGEYKAFGEDARSQYQDMGCDIQKDWYFLERFKTKLLVRGTPLDKEIEIEDILGKKVSAKNIFTASIKCMKEHLLRYLWKTNLFANETKIMKDIRWVLTVPAMWSDLSKRFMRDAAEAAGIQTENLDIALEPEACSLFCKRKLEVRTGEKFFMLDLGGGTSEITCFEVKQDDTLKELYPPTGGDFGGTMVDNAFLQLLYELFGEALIKKFKNEDPGAYIELMAEFEIKKRHFNGTNRVSVRFPDDILTMYHADSGLSIQESIKGTNFAEKLEFRDDELYISEGQMKELFDPAIDCITDATNKLLEEVRDPDLIILAGGFSESKYLRIRMTERFPNVTISPVDSFAATVKGTVIYGQNRLAISSRKCKYTYGIARMEKFIKGKHPEAKKRVMGDLTLCDDVFCKHIEIGTEVNVEEAGNSVEIEYYPPTADVKQAVLEVYKSTEKNPMFVTDPDCEMVGFIKIDIDPQGDIWSKLLVKLVFGGTELLVQVRDVKNKHVIKGWVDFYG